MPLTAIHSEKHLVTYIDVGKLYAEGILVQTRTEIPKLIKNTYKRFQENVGA